MKQKHQIIVSGLPVLSLLGLAACSGGGGGDPVAPAAATLDVNDIQLAEGDSGSTFFDFVVSLSAAQESVVTVDFGTSDGTAQDEGGDGDYNAVSGSLSFDPGTTTQVVRVLVNGDVKLEGDETFTLGISNPAGAELGKSQGVGTISEDEVIAFSVDDTSAEESDFSTVTLEFTVTLGAEIAEAVSVDYATSDDSAHSGSFDGDYQATSGTLTFAPGVTQQTVSVAAYGDFVAEPDESFMVQLANPQGAGSTIADGQAFGTILDNDSELHVDEDPLTASTRPQLATSGQHVYAAWNDERNGAADVYFRSSSDGGVSWSEGQQRLDTDAPGAAVSTGVQVSASGDAVYVAWQDARNGATDVYFNASTDNGASWLADDVRVDTNTAGASGSSEVRLASSGSNVYVAWIDTRNGAGDVYFNYSHDGGVTWQVNDIRLDTDAPGTLSSYHLQLAAEGDQVNVVWVDNGDIYSNFSTDGGATWQPAQIRVDTDTTPFPNVAGSPRLAVDGTNVYVVWEDSRNGESDIYFNQSFDAGGNFGPIDRRLDTNDTIGAQPSTAPTIAVDGFSVYVAWQDNRASGNARDDIYFNVSHDGGITWAGDMRIDYGVTAGKAQSQGAAIACEGSNVAIVWSDLRNGPEYDLFATTSTDGGQSFFTRVRRLDTDAPGSASSRYADVLVSDGQVLTAWEDQRFNGDVYFKAFPVH
jgi:hypothetical protein